MSRIIFDIETNSLLNEDVVEYTTTHMRLKDNFSLWCIAAIDLDTSKVYVWSEETHPVPDEWERVSLDEMSSLLAGADVLAGHNIIDFDLPVLKLMGLLDYSIRMDKHTINGREALIVDTLTLAKTTNPDLKKGYSLEALAKLAGGHQKGSFGKEVGFEKYSPDMLEYCVQDVEANADVFRMLFKLYEERDLHKPYMLEACTRDIVSEQAHVGFYFDKELAERVVADLDAKMDAIREEVEPLLPPKPLTKTRLKLFTPPAKQLKKDGSLSSHMVRFLERHEVDPEGLALGSEVVLYGNKYTIPLPAGKPVLEEEKATLDDTTLVKQWLIGEHGWQPTEWSERDLTMNSDKSKGKLSRQQLMEAIERYIENCKALPEFTKFRCEPFNARSIEGLRMKLMEHAVQGRPIKVRTAPSFTIGVQKELCPDLLRVGKEIGAIDKIVDFLTYRHRRTLVLGGKYSIDDEEPAKGFLSSYRRSDSRIATPADSCGTATSRFKHRVVANIPRPSSLYGGPIRELFGVDDDHVQIGYDFDGLEARIEAHYCWDFDDEEKTYCKSLIQEKPNDVHTRTAARISKIIGQPFERTPAKTVKYACAYGAQPKKLAQTLGMPESVSKKVFDAYWEAAKPLAKLKDYLTSKWKNEWGRKYIIGIDGRRVPVRSPHSLVNYLFQGAGVICAKVAMCKHRELLEQHGLYVSYYDTGNDTLKVCRQMIAYHDEAQLQVHKSMVKCKSFASEKEAKEWKQKVESEKKILLSDVQSVDNRFLVCYSLSGELAVKAVAYATQHFHLNIPLTAGYMVGKNWSQCH